MSIVSALSELSGKRKAIEEKAREEAKQILAPGLQQFMKEHPEVKAIGWTQYTPYFNDGDPCEFSVGEIFASIADERDDSLYGDGWVELYSKPEEGFSAETWTALIELNKTLSGSDEELLAAFGDHVKVIVTHEGVEVEEFDHD
jgi:hypothetical protein